MRLDTFKSCTGLLPDNLDSLQKVAEIYSGFGNIDITAKHDEWIEVCEACARYGEGARECFHQFSNHYANYDRNECDYHFSNCLQSSRGDVSIGTVIWMMQQAGIDVLKELRQRNYLSTPRVGRPRKANDGDKEEAKEAVTQQWLNFLHAQGQFRYNAVLGKTEVLLEGEEDWKDFDKYKLNSAFTKFRAGGARFNMNDARIAVESDLLAPLYDPYKELLKSLNLSHPWDKTTDYITQVFGCLEFKNPDDKPFLQKMIKKWFLMMVALALGIIDDNQLMVVLVGPQGCGKTVLCRRLMRLLKRYYKVMQPSEKLDKDLLIQLSTFFLVVFDEFEMDRRTSNLMRAIITSNGSQVRAAWGYTAENRKRRASFIASTNNDQYLTDDQGDRRYLTVEVTDILHEEDYPLPLEEAFSQAYWIVTNEPSDTYVPTSDEWHEIAERNKEHVLPNFCEAVIPMYYRQPTAPETAKEVGASDILMQLPYIHAREWKLSNIGKALKALGFSSRKTNRGTRYLVEEIKPDERRIILHSDGARRFREVMNEQGIDVSDGSTQEPTEQTLPF